jgi:transcriptional regulator with XRE-family HTH domain
MNYGFILREARRKKNISQTSLAKQLETTQRTICRWERGKASITMEKLEKIASILEIPIQNFFVPTQQ